MVDIDVALVRLRLASDQSESMQWGLRHRQDDLLDLEEDVRLVASGRTTGRVVIDEAEDIRRSVAVYTTDHLLEIKVAIDRASLTLAVATSDGDVPPDLAVRLKRLIGNATRETLRANAHLAGVVNALRRISQAVPGEEDLARTAQVSIDSAAAQLDSARRATFRIGAPPRRRARAEGDLRSKGSGDCQHTAQNGPTRAAKHRTGGRPTSTA